MTRRSPKQLENGEIVAYLNGIEIIKSQKIFSTFELKNLKNHENQRKLDRPHINRIKESIQKNHDKTTSCYVLGDAITVVYLDNEYILFDGNHRRTACVELDMGCIANVIREITKEQAIQLFLDGQNGKSHNPNHQCDTLYNQGENIAIQESYNALDKHFTGWRSDGSNKKSAIQKRLSWLSNIFTCCVGNSTLGSFIKFIDETKKLNQKEIKDRVEHSIACLSIMDELCSFEDHYINGKTYSKKIGKSSLNLWNDANVFHALMQILYVMSVKYKGDINKVKKAFERLVTYCPVESMSLIESCYIESFGRGGSGTKENWVASSIINGYNTYIEKGKNRLPLNCEKHLYEIAKGCEKMKMFTHSIYRDEEFKETEKYFELYSLGDKYIKMRESNKIATKKVRKRELVHA